MRFPPIDQDQWSGAQRRLAAEITSGPRGQLRGPFVPLLYSPEVASHVQKLGEYLRFNTQLPNALLEIAILVTARHFNCANIWQSHRDLALKAGLDPATIASIAVRQRPSSMSGREAAIYDFSSELTRDIGVSDTTFDRVVGLWNKPTAIDLICSCGYYVLLALVLNTARIPLPDGSMPFEP